MDLRQAAAVSSDVRVGTCCARSGVAAARRGADGGREARGEQPGNVLTVGDRAQHRLRPGELPRPDVRPRDQVADPLTRASAPAAGRSSHHVRVRIEADSMTVNGRLMRHRQRDAEAHHDAAGGDRVDGRAGREPGEQRQQPDGRDRQHDEPRGADGDRARGPPRGERGGRVEAMSARKYRPTLRTWNAPIASDCQRGAPCQRSCSPGGSVSGSPRTGSNSCSFTAAAPGARARRRGDRSRSRRRCGLPRAASPGRDSRAPARRRTGGPRSTFTRTSRRRAVARSCGRRAAAPRRPAGHLDLEVAELRLGAVHPEVAHDAADLAVGAEDLHAARIGVARLDHVSRSATRSGTIVGRPSQVMSGTSARSA